MNKITNCDKQSSWLHRMVRLVRWKVAAPILRPILAEWAEAEADARRSAQMKGQPREWVIEMNAMSEGMACRRMDIELAFGCASFDEKKHYVRHYS